MVNLNNKRTKQLRVPMNVYNEFNKSLEERFRNGLITKKDLKASEGFKLISRMPEWKLALQKLKRLPKREDLK